jgi:hypothetical protein
MYPAGINAVAPNPKPPETRSQRDRREPPNYVGRRAQRVVTGLLCPQGRQFHRFKQNMLGTGRVGDP